MRVVIQRVSEASVKIREEVKSSIKKGLLIFLGIEKNDGTEDVIWLSKKIAQLRIFSDERGLMNRSILETNGELLVVSQFTLHAKTKKGNRPSYIKAAKPEQAIPLYEEFIIVLEKEIGQTVKTGEFGANMQVSLCNDGPVTIIIDTKNKQ
ncbi:MAG: D-tyrosyl-tRNA(Tyr) deacylase [Flavobacteriales bacterium]|nr:D-tyrosyl-tRNA(Tyr) deacylase [Flavobacteriales bacterium]|tara:strand:+ start:1105 stop:1557 length:453 start_codon:yes stop_codon:yes gene_type:complete